MFYKHKKNVYFIYFIKASDHVKIHNVFEILHEKKENNDICIIILSSVQILKWRFEWWLIFISSINKYIWQEDSFNLLLLSVADKIIIISVKKLKGYRIGDYHINVTCHADVFVLKLGSYDHLQQLYKLCIKPKKFDLEINRKAKFVITAKEPVQYKLEVRIR